MEPITVPRANNAKPRPPRTVRVFPQINYYYSPVLSGGDSSRHCIKLSIAEAELDFMRTMKQLEKCFLLHQGLSLLATPLFIGDAAEQRPIPAASNHSVVLLSQPPPCAHDEEPEYSSANFFKPCLTRIERPRFAQVCMILVVSKCTSDQTEPPPALQGEQPQQSSSRSPTGSPPATEQSNFQQTQAEIVAHQAETIIEAGDD